MSFLSTTLGKIAATFGVAMVPVIELRGAIPLGVSWGLDLPTAIIVSIIGNIVPVPFIILFIKKIFALLRRISPKLDGFVGFFEKRGESKREQVERWAFWGLFVLVAIPLPGTGAWTGSLVAAMMDMKLKRAFPAIALGVLGAGAIVSIVTYGAFKIF